MTRRFYINLHLAAIDFSKAFNSVWHPAFSHKLVSAGLPPCFARWTLYPSFLIGALALFLKITKVASLESVEVFRKDPFLALYFSFFSSVIFLLLCLLPLAALLCGGGHIRNSVLTGVLV